MLKGKKKALAAQVLLGLMVAGNAYAATDITVTGEGASGGWGTMTTESSNKILCGDWCFITTKPNDNPNDNFGAILGGSLLLPGEQGTISDYNITVNAGIAGNNFTLIKGKNVTGNVITIGEGWPRKIDFWGSKEISNVFSGSESSVGNKFRLGILENPNGVEAVNIGDENDIELLGGKANTAGEGAPPNWVTADYSGISFSGRNLTLQDKDGTENIKSANMKGNISAARHLTATEDIVAGGDITAANGVTASSISAGGTLSAANGDVEATAGDITAGTIDVTNGALKAQQGDVVATSGITAKSVAVKGNLIANSPASAALYAMARAAGGDFTATGNVNVGGVLKANNVTVTGGDLTAGSVSANNVTLGNTNSLTLTSGGSNVAGTLQAGRVKLTGTSGLTVVNLQTDDITVDGANNISITNLTDTSGRVWDNTKQTAFNSSLASQKNYVDGAIFKKEYKATASFSSSGGVIISSSESGQEVREQSKSLVETQMASMALANGSADLVAGAGYVNAAQAVKEAKESGSAASAMVPYAAANYGSVRQESGSYVDVDSANFNIGFAKEVKNSNGTLLFGPMVEYGRGNYESHLDDGTVGTGNGQSFGVGVMARQTNDNGFYYEGSLRYGKSTSTYSSNNLVAGKTISYDNSANYWGAHAGVGKVVKLSGDNSIDMYGKLFYTRQGASSVNVDGDTLDFSAVSSKRSRIGFRYIHGTSQVRSIYAGLAWQHEFDGSAHATANGFSTPSPSVKGDSGMLELGVLIAPKASPVSFDLGVSGWAGKQKGYSLNANMCWSF